VKVEEIRAAVKRYRNFEDEFNDDLIEYENAKAIIADCLTDPSPITRTALEGIASDIHGEDLPAFIDDSQIAIRAGDFEVIFWFEPENRILVYIDDDYAEPQPKRLGDVAFLLWRLAR
jgi:hypothetical protein